MLSKSIVHFNEHQSGVIGCYRKCHIAAADNVWSLIFKMSRIIFSVYDKQFILASFMHVVNKLIHIFVFICYFVIVSDEKELHFPYISKL